MSERVAGGTLALVVAGLVAAACWTRVPEFWGDAATYHAMAWSLAEDGDLRFEARDLLRVRREYPSGPQGVFLKRASGGWILDGAAGFPWLRRVPAGEPRIYYAKPFLYPALAAPLVRVFGTRGLQLLNALCLALVLVWGYLERKRLGPPGRALALALALFLATVAPLYLFWLTPELSGMALIMAALLAWRRGWPVLSAVLFGIATYWKPPNLFLALPLGVEPFLDASRPWGRRLLSSLGRGGLLATIALALMGVNLAVTGEWNYQGGERKTFYDRFPFDPPKGDSPAPTFGNSGIWMTTNEVGPRVEGQATGPLERARRLVGALISGEAETQDAATPDPKTVRPPAAPRGAGPARAASEYRESFVRNLAYFWIGRFGGVVPYYLPFAAAVVCFLALGPRARAGWLALAALAVSWLFYIWMIPDNWYGGGGTVGNRYFLSLLPLAVFLAPAGREWIVAACGTLGAIVWLGPLYLAPIAHSLDPGRIARRPALRVFPAELTMLNDLNVFTQHWRKKQPVGDTEGDAHKHWPADPKAYYFYFFDDGTFGKEALDGAPGLWLRGGASAEVLVRALEPVRTMTIDVTGGPAGDDVTLRLGGEAVRLTLAPGETKRTVLRPPRGYHWYDTFLYTLRLRSRRGGPDPDDPRRLLGAFVRVTLEVDRRPPPKPAAAGS